MLVATVVDRSEMMVAGAESYHGDGGVNGGVDGRWCRDLAEITGFAAVSAQPNSGAQGEYAGLLCIRSYHESRGDHHR